MSTPNRYAHWSTDLLIERARAIVAERFVGRDDTDLLTAATDRLDALYYATPSPKARAIGDLTAFGHGNTAEEKRINRYWDLIDEHGEEAFYAEVDKVARKIQTMLIAANRSSMVPGDYGPIVHFSAAATLYLRERSDRVKAKEHSRRELDRRNAEIIQANVADEIMQANIVAGASAPASADDTQETR